MSSKKDFSPQIRLLAQAGISIGDIANYLGITEELIVKEYAQAFHRAVMDRTVQIADKVFDMAMEGNLTACQFWLKNIGKWEKYSESAPKMEESQLFTDIQVSILPQNEELYQKNKEISQNTDD